jgi:hypothetical protein
MHEIKVEGLRKGLAVGRRGTSIARETMGWDETCVLK